jgi:hypothetical protein
MKRPRYRSDRLLVAAQLLASCTFERTTSSEAVARHAASTLSANTGVPIEVTCPALAPDKINECQARAQTGETFTVEVRKGTVEDWDWTTKDVAFGGAVAEAIAPLISERAGVPVTVTCPVFALGNTCQATAPTGETFPVAVKKSTGQTLDWETKGATFGKAAAERIRKLYAEAHQMHLPNLACPPIILEDRAEPAMCQAQVQGVTVIFKIKAEPDGITFTGGRGFVPNDVAAKFAVDELAKRGVKAEVDCGQVPRLSIPNSQFTCTAKFASGETRPVYYRVTGNTGNNGTLEMLGTPFQ